MTAPDRWQRVEALYHAAQEQSAGKRAAFLDAACGGDVELRREVESLLAQPTDDGFLDVPAMAVAAPMTTSPGDSILTGRRIGPYQIQALIGVGGMGEVYRARDTQLGRAVAIKILPRAFTSDPERAARFEREARLLASLNHPNIATIHGIEDLDGLRALVLEFVEGETLAEHIQRGALPVPDALAIGRQIVDALDAAHEKGIVHRDLKPANIKITPDGTVKVLDFGLAKVMAGDGAGPDLSQAPMVTIGGTREGMILGTAAYMSPEQARGKPVDKRTDIWAFGCVLYEMLTGQPVFCGATVSDVIVSVLERTPNWTILPATTPLAVRRLLRRCFEKQARRRLRDIGDARLEMDDALVALSEVAPSEPSAGGLTDEVEFQRLTDVIGMKESPAVSPDGKMVAFVALVAGRRQIWIRLLAGGAPLQVTRDDADHEQPRWAADSSAIIYFTRGTAPGGHGTIWEIGTLGGPPRRVTTALAGGDISHDGQRIVVVQSTGEHSEVITIARDGSHRQSVAVLPRGDLYLSPRWAPDDSAIAFQCISGVRFFDMRLEIISVATGERHQVARSERLKGFSWLPDGSRLVYSSSWGSTLLYPPIFNLRVVDVEGRRDRQLTFGDVSYVDPDVHRSGRLVAGRTRGHSDIWRFPVTGSAADNTREALRITRQTGQAQTPSVSPDGTEVAYLSDNGGHGNLWVARTDSSSVRQITSERDPAVAIGMPVWSPVGSRIAFIVERGDQIGLSVVEPDGSGLREIVSHGWAPCWSADGQWLYYSVTREGSQGLEKVSVDSGTRVLVQSDGGWAAVTPEGTTVFFVRWLRSEIWGTWGEAEIHCAPIGGGPSHIVARIASGRVPIWPFTLQLFLSPDGQWLAAPLIDGATTNLWVLPAAGGSMRAVTDFGDRSILIARSVSWSADSQHLYAAVAESETDIVLLDGLVR